MAEAEQHARRLLIVQGGKILADDTTAAIIATHRSDLLILSLEGVENDSKPLEAARHHANGEPWIADRHLFIPMADAQKSGLIAAEAVRAAGTNITEFQIKRRSLEAAYLTIAKARFDKAPAPLRRAA